MPVRAAPVFSKIANAHTAFKIQNLFLFLPRWTFGVRCSHFIFLPELLLTHNIVLFV